MVKVIYCDRCGKEINRTNDTDFDEIFENLGGKNSSISISVGNDVIKKIISPQLCQNCLEGYNHIIDKTNENIKEYLKEGKQMSKEDRKSIIFKMFNRKNK